MRDRNYLISSGGDSYHGKRAIARASDNADLLQTAEVGVGRHAMVDNHSVYATVIGQLI